MRPSRILSNRYTLQKFIPQLMKNLKFAWFKILFIEWNFNSDHLWQHEWNVYFSKWRKNIKCISLYRHMFMSHVCMTRYQIYGFQFDFCQLIQYILNLLYFRHLFCLDALTNFVSMQCIYSKWIIYNRSARTISRFD